VISLAPAFASPTTAARAAPPFFEGAHQARGVGVVPDVSSVGTHDGVDRADRLRRGSHLVDQRDDCLFMRHREVVSVDPRLVLATNGVGQIARRDLETFVS